MNSMGVGVDVSNRNNNNSNNYYHRNDIVLNQNCQKRFQQRYKRANINNGYPRNQYLYEKTKFVRSPKTTRSTSRQRQPQQRQRRRSGSSQLQLNDFMPPQLRDASPANMPNLSVNFNLTTSNITATNTSSNIPVGALPQRSIFATQAIRTTNDTTQRFNVYDDSNENVNAQQPKQKKKNNQSEHQTTTTTTASYRRRQRRNRQQQYHNTNDRNGQNFNRFAALKQNDASTDIESNYDEGDDETIDSSSRIEDNMVDYSEKEQINKTNVKNGQNKND
ncbi:unnamed protein product [Rotaria socialis]